MVKGMLYFSETADTEKPEKEKEEKRPESTAIRNRRMRRERRSTGIANYTAEVSIAKENLNANEL